MNPPLPEPKFLTIRLHSLPLPSQWRSELQLKPSPANSKANGHSSADLRLTGMENGRPFIYVLSKQRPRGRQSFKIFTLWLFAEKVCWTPTLYCSKWFQNTFRQKPGAPCAFPLAGFPTSLWLWPCVLSFSARLRFLSSKHPRTPCPSNHHFFPYGFKASGPGKKALVLRNAVLVSHTGLPSAPPELTFVFPFQSRFSEWVWAPLFIATSLWLERN